MTRPLPLQIAPAVTLGLLVLTFLAFQVWDNLAQASTMDDETVRVPVLTRPLHAGEVVDSANLEMREVGRREVFAGTVLNREAVAGMKAVRNQVAGKPLAKIHFKPVPAVARDSNVLLRYRRPGVELSGSAQALADAQVGESVRVLNTASRATLLAVVIAPGEVEIR